MRLSCLSTTGIPHRALPKDTVPVPTGPSFFLCSPFPWSSLVPLLLAPPFLAAAAHAMPSTSVFGRRSGGRPRPWRGLAAVVAVSSLMMAAGAAVGLVVRGGGAVGLSGGVSFVLGGLGKTALGLWLGRGTGSAGGAGGAYGDFQTLPSGLRIKDGTWRGARWWKRASEALVRGGQGRGGSEGCLWGGTAAECLGGGTRVRPSSGGGGLLAVGDSSWRGERH